MSAEENPRAGLCRDAVRAAQRAYLIGLQLGSGGNFSVRGPGGDTVLIKPTGVSFGTCTEESLIEVDMDGTVVAGQGVPSRELPTHLSAYRARPDVGGVFHCHAPYTIACLASWGSIPIHTGHAENKLGQVPVLAFERSAEAMTRAVETLFRAHNSLRAFVQMRHGIFALGKTIQEAEDAAELVEETSKIAFVMYSSTSR